MPALTTQTPDSVDLLDQQMTQLREINIKNAKLAAGVVTMLVERVGAEAVVRPDIELARKAVDTLLKVAIHPEKQAAADKPASAAAAILTIVLDDNVPQVPPPKKKRVVTDVSDAVEIQATAVPPQQTADELSWGAL